MAGCQGGAFGRPEPERLYTRFCAPCHGKNGDGRGPDAADLRPRPRDFRPALFKYRTTPARSLPTDADLMRAISPGRGHGAVPSWSGLSRADRASIVRYLKTFSPRWTVEPPPAAISIPSAPAFLGSPASVQRGKELYELAQCGRCHGETGRGDGPSSGQLVDDLGDPISPADLTSQFIGEDAAYDVYVVLSTGLDGTPMASYVSFLSPTQRWHVASYLTHLARTRPRAPDDGPRYARRS